LIGTFVFRFSGGLCFDLRSQTKTKNEDVIVSKSVHVDVGCAINPGVSKMLATVFSAVLFAVTFAPSGNVDAAASAEPTCCAKHAYCCTVHAPCCGKHAEVNATTDELSSATSQPTCCAKRAHCCSVNARCCGNHAETKAATGDVASTTGQPTCCAKRAHCCSVGAACCGKGSASATEVEPAELS
tara:strand:- start:13702 stop:14256 length:555 start_codon:yes stop_codon:yes gene_type:complete